jgi:hypothetical protein
MIAGIPEPLPDWVRSMRDARHWLVYEYRAKGFAVIEDPTPDDLPESLWEYHIDLLSHRGDENIVTIIRRRNDISDNNLALTRLVKTLSGWRCDILVLPVSQITTASNASASKIPAGAAS